MKCETEHTLAQTRPRTSYTALLKKTQLQGRMPLAGCRRTSCAAVTRVSHSEATSGSSRDLACDDTIANSAGISRNTTKESQPSIPKYAQNVLTLPSSISCCPESLERCRARQWLTEPFPTVGNTCHPSMGPPIPPSDLYRTYPRRCLTIGPDGTWGPCSGS